MRMNPILLTLVLVGAVPALDATAENVFKCTGTNGAVVYQRERCEDARETEEKKIDPDKNVLKQELPPPSSTDSATRDSSRDKAPATNATESPAKRRRGGY